MQVTFEEFERLLDAATPPSPPNSTVKLNAANIRDFRPYHQAADLDLEKGFLEKLRRLRFRKLHFPPTASTKEWDTLLDAWVKQCCFLEADYPDENVRMSVQPETLDNVGTIWRWFLHWEPISDKGEREHKKQCMCIMIRVPDSQLPWGTFTDSSMQLEHARNSSLLPTDHPVRAFVSTLMKECKAEECEYALVVDSNFTMRIKFRKRTLDPDSAGLPFVAYQIIPAGTHSALYYVAAILSRFSRTFGLQGQRWRAAGPVQMAAPVFGKDEPKDFRDFGLCELERDRELYERFLTWKSAQHAEALAKPLLPGIVLSVQRDVIPRRFTPLKCPFDWAPVPDDCTTSIFARRPRCQQVDDLLRSDTPLVFRLQRDLRVYDEEDDAGSAELASEAGEEEEEEEEEEAENNSTTYSLVWSGQLGNAVSGEFLETELCVKLFDERLFPVPTLAKYDESLRSNGGFYGLNFPDEMLRREEAVYTRFSGGGGESSCPHLQGLSLPHCYGFHEFTVQEGPTKTRTMLGVLMERIVGVHVEDLLHEVFKKDSEWELEEKVALIKRLRNLIRVLNHAHFTQGDWHGKQILCIRRQDTPPGLSWDLLYDFVLIDFAFATHHTDRRLAVNHANDVGAFQGVLVENGIKVDVMTAVSWWEKDPWEV